MAAIKLDRFDEAIQDFERYLDLMEAEGDTWAYAEYLAQYGEILVERGEFIHAEDALLQARAILENGQPSSALIVADCGLVCLYCTWEVPHARALTIKYARDACRHANQLDIQVLKLQPLSCLAQAEVLFGQPNVALEHVQHIFESIELYQFNHFYPDVLWIKVWFWCALGNSSRQVRF